MYYVWRELCFVGRLKAQTRVWGDVGGGDDAALPRDVLFPASRLLSFLLRAGYLSASADSQDGGSGALCGSFPLIEAGAFGRGGGSGGGGGGGDGDGDAGDGGVDVVVGTANSTMEFPIEGVFSAPLVAMQPPRDI